MTDQVNIRAGNLPTAGMPNAAVQAPGWPGIEARWTSSAKSGVGTALGSGGRLWFTISHGILNEIYYPRVDQACTHDMGLLVTDRAAFFSEEKRHTRQQFAHLAAGVPAYHLTNTCDIELRKISWQTRCAKWCCSVFISRRLRVS